jgi:hypothetical protein
VLVQGSICYESEEDELPNLPPPHKKTKKNYDLTRRFQMEWSAKAPWNEMVLTQVGFLHMVKCSVCTSVKGHLVIMHPKWDTVRRHALRICHVKNDELYAQRHPTSVLDQIRGCSTLESKKKVIPSLYALVNALVVNLLLFLLLRSINSGLISNASSISNYQCWLFLNFFTA